jgi:hypothetical protein
LDRNDPGFSAAFAVQTTAAIRGVTVSWTLAASCIVGGWLMFSPLVFGTEGAIADSDHLAGAMIMTIAVCAMAEVARPLRFLNLPFRLSVADRGALVFRRRDRRHIKRYRSGLVIIGLSLERGRRSKEHYGSWDRYIV